MTPTMNESFLTAPLAIIGLACRLPGADNLDEYWQLLRTGRSELGELPDDRLERDLYYHPEKGVRGKSYAYLGGLVKDRPIDRTVCPASEELLQNSDIAHQIICEVAAAACRQPFAAARRQKSFSSP